MAVWRDLFGGEGIFHRHEFHRHYFRCLQHKRPFMHARENPSPTAFDRVAGGVFKPQVEVGGEWHRQPQFFLKFPDCGAFVTLPGAYHTAGGEVQHPRILVFAVGASLHQYFPGGVEYQYIIDPVYQATPPHLGARQFAGDRIRTIDDGDYFRGHCRIIKPMVAHGCCDAGEPLGNGRQII